jgi:WD40 repeat protein
MNVWRGKLTTMKHKWLWAFCFFLAVNIVNHTNSPVKAQTDREVLSVDWRPNGEQIALGYDDGSLEIWDVATNQIADTYQLPGSVLRFKWNPMDSRLVGVSPNENFDMVIWTLDTSTGERIDGLSGEFSVGDFDWNPTGDMVVSTDFIGMGSQDLVHLWEASENKFHTFEALDDYEFYTADWHPTEQRWIALAEQDGTLAVWDIQENILRSIALVGEIDEYDFLAGLSWSPTGNRIATVTYTENIEIWSWNEEILTSIAEFPDDPDTFSAQDILWSPDGNYLAIIEGYLVRIIDAETGSQIGTTSRLGFLRSAAWSPDSDAIVYAGRGNDIDTSNWEILDLDTMVDETPTPHP